MFSLQKKIGKPQRRQPKPKMIKQRCFNRKWGRGEGDFRHGLAIYRDYMYYYLETLQYTTAEIHGMRHFGLIVATQFI
jgi:hypothetical protein